MELWKSSNTRIISCTGWVPNFIPEKAFIAYHPIWVVLPGLPIEYWDASHLRQIVQPFGRLRRLDEVALNQGKSSGKALFAQVPVEFDLSQPVLDGIKNSTHGRYQIPAVAL